MRNRFFASLRMTWVAFALLGCGTAAPAAQPASSGGSQWDQVVAAAKKEGALVLTGQAGSAVAEALTSGFKRRYPEISVDFTGGNGNELITKMMTERRASRYTIDLMVQGPPNLLDLVAAEAVDPIPPLLVGPETDASKWPDGKFSFSDNAGKYVLAMLGGMGGVGIYNPKAVNISELTTYKDLLNPKWKGKLAMLDPRLPGSAQAAVQFWYISPDLGKDFIKQLFDQQIAINKDDRQLTDWVAKGEYPIGLGANGFAAVELRKQGVALEFISAANLKEGGHLTASWGGVAVLNKAPHPNATKVYLNWLLSKEGQEALVRAAGYPSRRLDVSTEGVLDATLVRASTHLIELNKEDYVKQRPEVVAYLKTLLGS